MRQLIVWLDALAFNVVLLLLIGWAITGRAVNNVWKFFRRRI